MALQYFIRNSPPIRSQTDVHEPTSDMRAAGRPAKQQRARVKRKKLRKKKRVEQQQWHQQQQQQQHGDRLRIASKYGVSTSANSNGGSGDDGESAEMRPPVPSITVDMSQSPVPR